MRDLCPVAAVSEPDGSMVCSSASGSESLGGGLAGGTSLLRGVGDSSSVGRTLLGEGAEVCAVAVVAPLASGGVEFLAEEASFRASAELNSTSSTAARRESLRVGSTSSGAIGWASAAGGVLLSAGE